MKTFRGFVDDTQHSETVEELDEGALRNLGSAFLFSRVVSQSNQIKRSKSVEEKLDLLA